MERVQKFRRDGRFLPGTQTLFGTKHHDGEYHPPQRTSTDVWDEVLKTVVARSRPKKSLGRQITSQIANKILTYFDNQESRKIKAKEAEDRRLRNLAKSTMKLVIGEWKKAIFVSVKFIIWAPTYVHVKSTYERNTGWSSKRRNLNVVTLI